LQILKQGLKGDEANMQECQVSVCLTPTSAAPAMSTNLPSRNKNIAKVPQMFLSQDIS